MAAFSNHACQENRERKSQAETRTTAGYNLFFDMSFPENKDTGQLYLFRLLSPRNYKDLTGFHREPLFIRVTIKPVRFQI
jgi:hypothetical protein